MLNAMGGGRSQTLNHGRRKETPRQKMIGMMYLVLTALLALNISKEVLNGFVKVEEQLARHQHAERQGC